MFVRHLDEITQSEATVDTGDWASRRLVLARDGRDYSLHDTLMRAGSHTLIDYPHHLESAYCIEGEGELEDLVQGRRHPITPGTVYGLEALDRIRLHAHTDLRLICTVTPPLIGGERLDDQGGFPVAAHARPALRKKNVFVVNLNDFNLGRLRSIRNAENYNFLKLLDASDVLEQDHYDIDAILTKARAELERYPGRVDGLIHYIDFPVSTTVPILCSEYGLPSASLRPCSGASTSTGAGSSSSSASPSIFRSSRPSIRSTTTPCRHSGSSFRSGSSRSSRSRRTWGS